MGEFSGRSALVAAMMVGVCVSAATVSAAPPSLANLRITMLRVEKDAQNPAGIEIRYDNAARPVSCTITETSGSAKVDAAVCDKWMSSAKKRVQISPRASAELPVPGVPTTKRVPAPAAPLRFNDDWHMVETKAGCRLEASVAGGKLVEGLSLEPRLRLTEIGSIKLPLKPGFERSDYTAGVKVGELDARRTWTNYNPEGASKFSLRLGLMPSELRAMSTGSPLVVGLPGEVIAVPMSRAALMVPALSKCDTAAKEKAMGSLPPPNPGGTDAEAIKPLYTLFGPNDYPGDALRAGTQGVVPVLYRISRKGRITECIATDKASPVLEYQTCALLRLRARYKPALNAKGEPVEDVSSTVITWLVQTG